MPRTALPPTPASSTDINGMDGTKQLSSLKMTFELPEPAMSNSNRSGSNSRASGPVSPVSATSPKKPFPIQPSEAVKARRRSSAAAAREAASNTSSTFALPPPPTRSRKIIQMKPRPQRDEKKPATESASTAGGKGAAKKPAAATVDPASAPASGSATGEANPQKKKQPSSTSAAGRKIARKTAHSLIERRRRSKMNEEFAVLKDMIPACEGEMHKLAILQASIEYVRYLKDCIEKLKAQTASQASVDMTNPAISSVQTSHTPEYQHQSQHESQHQPQHSVDVEMVESDGVATPAQNSTSIHSRNSSASPAMRPRDEPSSPSSSSSPSASYPSPTSTRRHDSWAPAYPVSAPEHHRHYSYASSVTTSPALAPGWNQNHGSALVGSFHHSNAGTAGSALTSPALGPLLDRADLDHEATAALLMLNSDRRGMVAGSGGGGSGSNGGGVSSGGQGRGMSVRDLLSS